MRLKIKEVESIVSVLQPILSRTGGKLYLFGSRADDSKKGGDIDLLLVVPLNELDLCRSQKIKWIDEIHSRLGEQRIDITIAAPEDLESDEFLRSIRSTLVPL